MSNIPRKMITYKLQSLHQTGLNDNCFISVHQTRSGNVKYKKILFGKNMNIDHDVFLIGDIFIQLFSHSWTGTSRLARINYNLFFLNPHAELNVKQFQVVFHSKNISAKKDCEPFSIVLDFEYYCLCHVSNTEGLECLCSKERKV